MKYSKIVQAEFIERPNRFIAYVLLNGKRERVHVKNTGRCRELLVSGAAVYLEKGDNPKRATAYDLIAVQKNGRTINMDSQAPNKVVGEWLASGKAFENVRLIRPETVYGNSRFDFYVETDTEKIFLEVKGVTLEDDGIVRFPDAPSERAVKHVEELAAAAKAGYRVFVVFVIQMEGVRFLMPNYETHAQFGEALVKARKAGVEILAFDCLVEPDSLVLHEPVPVYLTRKEQMAAQNAPRFSDTERLRKVVQRLVPWYEQGHRKLPWRSNPLPYYVWVSEIMLQQTRVEAVKPYFERFISALPDIASLAEAEEETLLKLWEGLGYYNRVRNLQRTAVEIMHNHEGLMPDTYEELIRLPGIGSYTAGAIASIAFGKPVPAVDGNVLRVLSRVRKDDRAVSEARVRTSVETELLQVMPKDCPGAFNQALMELGACVCVPNGTPHCTDCPLREICLAHRDGEETDYPIKAGPTPRKIEEMTVLIIRDENRTAVRKRPDSGLLAGMYEFPFLKGFCSADAVVQYLSKQGFRIVRIVPLEDAKHIFSHREWHMKGYMVWADELERHPAKGAFSDWIYIDPQETKDRYPIPAAYSAYTRLLSMKLGRERMEEET